ncbi:hypothetical protein QTV49_004228 [Vibrio vulnificus]|nr:hypothetical protein [Vibrio vulnificus]
MTDDNLPISNKAVLGCSFVAFLALLAGAASWNAIDYSPRNQNAVTAESLGLDPHKYYVATVVKEMIPLNEFGRPFQCDKLLNQISTDQFISTRDAINASYCKALGLKNLLPETKSNCSIFEFLKSESRYNENYESSLSNYCAK